MSFFANLKHDDIVSNGYASLEFAKKKPDKDQKNTYDVRVLSMIYLASNNLLDSREAASAFRTIHESSNHGIMEALVTSQSSAAKSIVRTFFPGAVEYGAIAFVKSLLNNGIDPSSPTTPFGEKPLATAIRTRNVQMTQLLLNYAADVNGVYDKKTMLTLAVKAGGFEIVQLILSSGANINAAVHSPYGLGEDNGRTALQVAARLGNFELVQLLLCYGADVDLCPHRVRETALAEAASTGNAELVLLLLDYGPIDIMSALSAAVGTGSLEIVQLLMRYADSGMRNFSNDAAARITSTALQAAAGAGQSGTRPFTGQHWRERQC